MAKRLKEAFTSNGIFLNKKISLHFSLQKGEDSERKLGSFDLDLEGRSNIARKLVLILTFTAVFLGCSSSFYQKTRKIFSKST